MMKFSIYGKKMFRTANQIQPGNCWWLMKIEDIHWFPSETLKSCINRLNIGSLIDSLFLVDTAVAGLWQMAAANGLSQEIQGSSIQTTEIRGRNMQHMLVGRINGISSHFPLGDSTGTPPHLLCRALVEDSASEQTNQELGCQWYPPVI